MFEKFDITKSLLPRERFHPYPTASQRSAWENLPGQFSRVLLERGEAALGFQWPPCRRRSSSSSSAMATAPITKRRTSPGATPWQTWSSPSAWKTAVASSTTSPTASGRFARKPTGASRLTSSCRKPARACPTSAEPTVDLFAAETAALLAWLDYLLAERLDTVSPLLRPRLQAETRRRVLEPCLARDDFWWMGFPETRSVNNWNPWINSNWLAAALLLESDEVRRQAAVQKILRSLEYFLDVYGEAGGCDEGPGYWSRAAASLFDCLELLHPATAGAVDVFDQPKIQNMGRFIYRAHIHESYYVNFADASATNTPDAALVFRYGERIGDAGMQAFGAWLADRTSPAERLKHQSLGRLLPALFRMERLPSVKPAQPLPKTCWFDDIQVLAAREREGSPDGFFLAAKGGHNAESHNHNDVGNFIVYTDCKPVIVDAGVETYSRKTFSPQRYEIWTMQSAYHSLLPSLLVGTEWLQQLPGKEFAAREVACDLEIPSLSMDIAGAYPPEACLLSWKRSLELQGSRQVCVSDAFAFDEAILSQKGGLQAIQLSLLTPCSVGEVSTEPGADGMNLLELLPNEFLPGRLSGNCRLLFPAGAFSVSVESVPIDDERLSPVWGGRLNRILFTAWHPPLQGSWLFRFLEAD